MLLIVCEGDDDFVYISSVPNGQWLIRTKTSWCCITGLRYATLALNRRKTVVIWRTRHLLLTS